MDAPFCCTLGKQCSSVLLFLHEEVKYKHDLMGGRYSQERYPGAEGQCLCWAWRGKAASGPSLQGPAA